LILTSRVSAPLFTPPSLFEGLWEDSFNKLPRDEVNIGELVQGLPLGLSFPVFSSPFFLEGDYATMAGDRLAAIRDL